jgi:hypothetical protein
VKVSPRPCYSHDVEQVRDILERLHELAPLCAPVTVNVASLQDDRGANGWAQQQWEHYGNEEKVVIPIQGDEVTTRSRNWDGVIFLSGRTTEIHPAIARYVVPHEYAHILEDALGLIRYPHAKGDNGRQLIQEWAKVRAIPVEQFDLRYGTTTHHLMPGEIFANDFRHFVGAETEWWPHGEVVPALAHLPRAKYRKAAGWWEDALAELRACYREASDAAAKITPSSPA